MINELAQYLRKIPIKQWPNGDENRTQPGKHNPQQNKSSYTAGKKAGMMRLICKIKENNRRGISNHDRKAIFDRAGQGSSRIHSRMIRPTFKGYCHSPSTGVFKERPFSDAGTY